MPTSPTLLDNLYEAYLDETEDSRNNKLGFIKALNRLLFRMELTKPAEMVSNIYYIDGFSDYQIPTGMRQPIGIYNENGEVIYYVSPQRFRWEEPANAFTDQGDDGKRYLRIRYPQTTSVVTIMTMADNLTADGTWAISGGSGLAVDEVTKKEGAGSITFTVSSASCVVSFTKSSVMDMSAMTEYARSRFYMWFPGASYLPTSLTIKIGNDNSNYFSQTVTTQASGLPFKEGVANEIEFALENATETGSVDRGSIDYFEVTLTFSASVSRSGFKINKIVLAKPEVLEMEWYTNYVAYDSSGNLIQSITESSEATDEPIIKDYPDYVNTALDGLCYDFLKVKDPARAQAFYTRFVGEEKNGISFSGLMYLRKKYPPRQAAYKRFKQLPPLNRGVGNSGIFTSFSRE